MPRKGHAYPVDDEWRSRVEERLKELGLKRSDLAKTVGCQRSLITELLQTNPHKNQRNHTTFLPEIHAALFWPAPQAVLGPSEVPELGYLYERLDDRGKAVVLGVARKELDRLLARGVGEGLPTRRPK